MALQSVSYRKVATGTSRFSKRSFPTGKIRDLVCGAVVDKCQNKILLQTYKQLEKLKGKCKKFCVDRD